MRQLKILNVNDYFFGVSFEGMFPYYVHDAYVCDKETALIFCYDLSGVRFDFPFYCQYKHEDNKAVFFNFLKGVKI